MYRYPSEIELSHIECWALHGAIEFFDFIKSIWAFPEYIEEYEDDRFKYMVFGTGGWSGNEDIIRSIEKNFAMWGLHWYCSYANGTHCFRLEKNAAYLKVNDAFMENSKGSNL